MQVNVFIGSTVTLKSSSSVPVSSDQRKAMEILRHRTFRGVGHSEKDIQWAVEIIRQHDPNHPLLRYSERGQLKFNDAE